MAQPVVILSTIVQTARVVQPLAVMSLLRGLPTYPLLNSHFPHVCGPQGGRSYTASFDCVSTFGTPKIARVMQPHLA